MNRSLKELFAIALEVKAIYSAFEQANADKHISIQEGLSLVDQVLSIFVKHNITVAELQEILAEVGPFLGK